MLITGVTGFCGGWLALWLKSVGADVYGLGLEPETAPNLFEAAKVGDICKTSIIDIRDAAATNEFVARVAPEIVFHLAAQPFVRRSYRLPAETFATNVTGTLNVLEAARLAGCKAVLAVTTDKVYKNKEWVWAYREDDELGGGDPYSASKSCAELVASSYRYSFPAGPKIATARGGNIIGGGDWSEDRLIPDFVRALSGGAPLKIRNPASTRPWQHVLALCHAYVVLGYTLLKYPEVAERGWNFGPAVNDAVPVSQILDAMQASWRPLDIVYEKSVLNEARALQLDSSLAHAVLGWLPAMDLAKTIAQTAIWYRSFHEDKASAQSLCQEQIAAYRAAVSGR